MKRAGCQLPGGPRFDEPSKAKNHPMKNKTLFLLAVGMLTVAVLAIGCASTKTTESLLAAAGFKMMPATTPAQEAH